jgi:hypothetical protein
MALINSDSEEPASEKRNPFTFQIHSLTLVPFNDSLSVTTIETASSSSSRHSSQPGNTKHRQNLNPVRHRTTVSECTMKGASFQLDQKCSNAIQKKRSVATGEASNA